MLGAVSQVFLFLQDKLGQGQSVCHLHSSLLLPLKDEVVHGVSNWERPEEGLGQQGLSVTLRIGGWAEPQMVVQVRGPRCLFFFTFTRGETFKLIPRPSHRGLSWGSVPHPMAKDD